MAMTYRSHPLETGIPPAWASEWGDDIYGPFIGFEVANGVESVSQWLRWIPPGTFMMGSPESENGRWEDEGPQHQVIISQGYWLGEMPVTQALWQAVMNDNPSRFLSPTRPVEQVSWNDCQLFIEKLNGLIPGLDARLPTEAEWEWACRARTTEATYAGPIEILGQRNAPVLDRIAWYGGNSGLGFELNEGDDSSGWKDKQYEHSRAGSHHVGQKDPNGFGLYDMLGNVWEWCSDYWGDYTADPVTDPSGPEAGADRVDRGGSWGGYAGGCRAACRSRVGPVIRYDILGLRLARGPSW